eukprot:8190849-Pyramimonas_sp.AAC.1
MGEHRLGELHDCHAPPGLALQRPRLPQDPRHAPRGQAQRQDAPGHVPRPQGLVLRRPRQGRR